MSTGSFNPCASCRCLVKSHDATCPFCGALVLPRTGVAHRVHAPRMSRAMWLAFGSSIATAAGLACATSPTVPTDTVGSASNVDPREDSGDHDADAIDAFVIDGEGRTDGEVPLSWATCDAGTGCACTPCGSSTCDTATEYCEEAHYKCTGQPSCTRATFRCMPRTYGVVCNAAPAISCTQDACGRVVQVATAEDCCSTCNIGCATSGCYGSPPARLERKYLQSIA